MKAHAFQRRERGFTFVELLIGASAAGAVAIAIFSFIHAGMFLSAKNLSVNLSSNHLRSALDRVENALTQADDMPVLINTSGATVGSGSAAGVKFDRYIGGPYVITSPAAPLLAATTSLTLTRSAHAATAAPVPRVGDLIRIDSTDATLRPRIATVGAGTTAANRHAVPVTLSSALGTAVTPIVSTIMTAKLIRHVAFIVMPTGGRYELRYYDSFNTTTNLNDATKYAVVTDQISPVSGDITPFSIETTTFSTTPLVERQTVNVGIRVRASNFDRRLVGKQNDEFNNFSRADARIRPKVNP